MKIVSTTLVGPNALEEGVYYALESVASFVDACIVIDTTSHILDEVCYTADPIFSVAAPIVFARWPWQNDYAAARNAALQFAREQGADWAITVDCDERIEPHGEDMRAIVEKADAQGANGLLSQDEEETYRKPRALKCTSDVRWMGRVHESIILVSKESLHMFPKMRFSETPKGGDDLKRKFERDIPLLKADIADDPKCTRAWYYLGSSLHGVGDIEGAIAAFKQCAQLYGWYEESAWACYRAAVLLSHLDRQDEALECCAAGMRRDAGMAELPALAAVISFNRGLHEQARCFAEIARLHGLGSPAFARRLGFAHKAMIVQAVDQILTPPETPAKL